MLCILQNNSNSEARPAKKRRRRAVQALHSSHLSKKYTDLIDMKTKYFEIQLEVLKSEVATKKEREALEFEWKKKIADKELEHLTLDLEIERQRKTIEFDLRKKFLK